VPTVVTNAASSVTFSTAVLNGTGNPNGASATGWFRYSTTNPGTCDDVFGTRAPVSGGDALGSGSSAVAFSESVTGLSEATTYYYCAIGSNVGGTGVGSVQNFTTPANTLPVAPSGATASNVSGTENAISWTDNSFNEAGFKVERSTNGGLYTQIATTSANAISYNDTSAIADNTYTYRVRAYNIVGNSSYNTTDYVITATVVPNDPTSLDYYIGTTSVDVVMFWSHTGNNEDGFKIERSTDNVNFSIVGTSNRSTLYHFETAPGSGTYYYRVYAHNAVGNSGNSNTITVVVP
jgi:hypothetical protein